jgi:hypothetical protein
MYTRHSTICETSGYDGRGRLRRGGGEKAPKKTVAFVAEAEKKTKNDVAQASAKTFGKEPWAPVESKLPSRGGGNLRKNFAVVSSVHITSMHIAHARLASSARAGKLC